METYFLEDQQKAKNWDLIQERNALRTELVRLKDESQHIGAAVQKYWAATMEPTSHSFLCRDGEVEVCRIVGEKLLPGIVPARTLLATIPQIYFDLEESVRLQARIKTCESELARINQQLKAWGV